MQVPIAILRLPQVKAATGMSRSTLYKWITDGNFPPPVQLGPRSVGWRVKDIETWVSTRVAKTKR